MLETRPSPYLTVEEVAARLRIHPDTVRRWLRLGKLAGIPLGDKSGWRVSEEALANYLAALVAERSA